MYIDRLYDVKFFFVKISVKDSSKGWSFAQENIGKPPGP